MSFRSIQHLLGLPPAVASVFRQLQKQRKFLQQAIEPSLEKAMRSNDGSLDEKDLQKIRLYYGLAVPAILGESFCALHGRPMASSERLASTCQGAITGLFDDFFDKDFLDDAAIHEKIQWQGNTIIEASVKEKLFQHFYELALQQVPSASTMKQALLAVYDAQVKSKAQAGGGLSQQSIREITMEKGGTSLLFYRTAFNNPLSEAEQQLLYRFGGLMQLSNDIFDVYKDRASGIDTLLTTSTDVQTVRSYFDKELEQCVKLTLLCSPDLKRAKRFFSMLSIGIFSRCYVCLDQLQALQPTTQHQFQLHAYSRKQLICDMDTKKNMLRSAAYHIKLMQQFFN